MLCGSVFFAFAVLVDTQHFSDGASISTISLIHSVSFSHFLICFDNVYILSYTLFSYSNFGPNTTSFVIPGEIFPAEV